MLLIDVESGNFPLGDRLPIWDAIAQLCFGVAIAVV